MQSSHNVEVRAVGKPVHGRECSIVCVFNSDMLLLHQQLVWNECHAKSYPVDRI